MQDYARIARKITLVLFLSQGLSSAGFIAAFTVNALVAVDLTGLTAIGVDEIRAWRGHKYLTLVYQIDEGHRRLLWMGNERKAKTLLRFFRWLGKERTALLRFVCSDMWKPYLKVIAKKAGAALHVLDRFHVMTHLNKAH